MNNSWSIRLARLTSQRSRWSSNTPTLPKPWPWPQNRRLSSISISEPQNQTVMFLCMKFSTAAVAWLWVHIIFCSPQVKFYQHPGESLPITPHHILKTIFLSPPPLSILFLLYLLSNFPSVHEFEAKEKLVFIRKSTQSYCLYLFITVRCTITTFCTEHILSVA